MLIPHDISLRLINLLQIYLRYDRLLPGEGVAHLSPMVQCPALENACAGRGPRTAPDGSQYFYTGFVYTERADDGSSVLWADNVYLGSAGGWTYSHHTSNVKCPVHPTGSADDLEGQHRAHADGRVDWLPASRLKLGGGGRDATLRIDGLGYWWY